MILDEAIEILKHPAPPVGSVAFHDYFKASQLGFEALKRVQMGRCDGMTSWIKPLPGETKD